MGVPYAMAAQSNSGCVPAGVVAEIMELPHAVLPVGSDGTKVGVSVGGVADVLGGGEADGVSWATSAGPTVIVMRYPIGATSPQLAPVSSHSDPIGPTISSVATPRVEAVNAVQDALSGHGGVPAGWLGVSTAGSDVVGVCHATS